MRSILLTERTVVPRFLRYKEVQARTGLSRATLTRRVAAGTFPQPIPLDSPHTVGFIEAEVQQWIADRIIAARGQTAAPFLPAA